MTTLLDSEHDELRAKISRYRNSVKVAGRENRDCLKDALQAVEDTFEGIRATISNAIDTATSPYGVTYTATEKKMLVKLEPDILLLFSRKMMLLADYFAMEYRISN